MCELQNFWLVVNGNDVLLLDIFLLLYIRYCTFWFKYSTYHYDFEAKSVVVSLFGPPTFLISQNGPRLKKVGHP